jgi:hypothetical protein
MQVRRVVTGQTAGGKSVFVSDEQVAPITVDLLPGAQFSTLWGSDALVPLPSAGDAPATHGYFPPAGGFRFGVVTLAPNSATLPAGLDMDAALAELDAKLPGLAEALESDNPGMHRTDTVDFNLILSGEVWLELDDGAEQHLRQGDCVVQNGTRHAWRNKSAAPCVLVVTVAGAQRSA